MKKTIAILLAIVFAFSALSTPVLAWHPDDPRYNSGGGYDETDDSGWGDPSRSPVEPGDKIIYLGKTEESSTIDCRTWMGCLLFYFGGFTPRSEKPSNLNSNSEYTSYGVFGKSSRAAQR